MLLSSRKCPFSGIIRSFLISLVREKREIVYSWKQLYRLILAVRQNRSEIYQKSGEKLFWKINLKLKTWLSEQYNVLWILYRKKVILTNGMIVMIRIHQIRPFSRFFPDFTVPKRIKIMVHVLTNIAATTSLYW